MPLNRLDQAAISVNRDILANFAPLLNKSEAVANYVADQLMDWKTGSETFLEAEFPFSTYAQALSDWAHVIGGPSVSRADLKKAVEDYTAFCHVVRHPTNGSFWKNQLAVRAGNQKDQEALPDELSVSGRVLLNEWQKSLDKARGEWELKTIQKLRAQFIEQLELFLEQLLQLCAQLEILGLDPGLLLDLSKGNLSAQDIEQFQRWSKYLEDDEGVRALCELLGKVRQIALSEKIDQVTVHRTREIHLPDINSREEIIGIRLGRDLEHVLPSEKALLADPDTAVLFDLKYVESRLMCFDMQGIQAVQEHIETDEDWQVQEEEKQGPMVICVDTSGSMSGMPETIAKAVALFISARAREQKRPCYLINFSTGIQTLELSDDMGMASLINFLKMSFHGGTDVAPALDHALEIMERDAYQKADLLIISDFIMAGLPETVLADINSQRANGNRFYSLVVGSTYMTQRLQSLFDHEWVFDPETSRIQELVGFQERMQRDTNNPMNATW